MASCHGQVIVVGNEKGGSGKSTTAMHLIIGLMQRGLNVASIDLDVRQSTLTRYLANRKVYSKAVNKEVSMPLHFSGEDIIKGETKSFNEVQLAERLQILIDGTRINHDVLVVDTPGSDTTMSRNAHAEANVLVTPVNDSFVDLDVLGHISVKNKQIMGPSHYTEMVLDRCLNSNRKPNAVDWFVLRNRIGTLNSHNAQDVKWALAELSNFFKFTVLPGFSERVIFRELFLVGLTILDLKDASGSETISSSHKAAREEIETLVSSIINTLGF